ncbi:MAG TPA: TonB-dependent receptor [Steroidobacteraceae bacterium]|jgi:outer membrane receptor protein involved in Fe transport
MDSRWGYGLPSLSLKISALLLPALVSLAWLWSAAASASAPTVFHIAAGEATVTLNEFSRQSSLQLLFDFRQVRGKRTLPVEGSLDPGEALRQMLTNTGLVFDFVNERTLAVTPVKQASAAGSATPPQLSNAIHGPRRLGSGLGPADGAGSGLPASEFEPIDTVNVTGTYFRGATPVGSSTLSFGRPEIAASGAVTAGQFLRTLSQVFGGGPTQDTRQIGPEAQTNSGFGTGINLRGLGARETLVLIDGRRLAPGGSEASFVDIENIPLSAVERIDVLPDGESAVYGADAVGGVVNFIMRDRFAGAETELTGGPGTRQSLGSEQVAQSLGKKWDNANAMVTVDYYRADGLPTADRSYAASDLRSFGGGNFDVPTANPGTLIVAGRTYALPAHQDGTALSLASLAAGTQNLQDRYLGADLVPRQQRSSVYGSGRTLLAEQLSVFASLLLVDRQASYLGTGAANPNLLVPASNPFNPTRGAAPVLVSYNFLDDLGPLTTDVTVKTTNATAGFDWPLVGTWNLHGYGQYARERELSSTRGLVNSTALTAALADPDPTTSFDPFGDGSHTNVDTLRSIAAGSDFRVDSQTESADLDVDGTLARLPGGELRMAAGLDHRTQFYETGNPASAFSPEYAAHRSRQVTAAFAEVVLPLFGEENARAGLRKLDLSVAVRHEDYSGVGDATTPKFGLAWSPLPSLALRTTWSRSVRAPTLADLDESQNIAITQFIQSATAPGSSAALLVWSGKNAALKEERARSLSAGLDFNPVAIPEVSLGLTWFDIDFRDGIEKPDFSADLLTNPVYSSLVIRNPPAALVAKVCQDSLYFQGSKANCASGVQAVLDLRAHNAAALRTRGLDFAAQYRLGIASGQLEGRVDGTYLLRYALAETAGAPLASLLNTQHDPVNLRLRAALGWKSARFGWVAALNYTNSYRDLASNAPVSAWTTCDTQIFYEPGGEATGPLARTRFELNTTNLFNRPPPFLNNQIVGIGYDQENADPYGRLLNLRIRKSW